MPIASHENDGTALARLKPATWVWLRDEDGIVHRAFERVLYFGTSTNYTLLCAGDVAIEPEPVSGPTTCMLCLSGEPDEGSMEKALGSAVPRPQKARTTPVARRRPSIR